MHAVDFQVERASRRGGPADRLRTMGAVFSVGGHFLLLAGLVLFATRRGVELPTSTRGPSAISVFLVNDAQDGQAQSQQESQEAPAPPPVTPTIAARRVAVGDDTTLPEPGTTVAVPAVVAGAPSQTGQVVAATSATTDPAAGQDYRRKLLEHIASYRRRPATGAGRAAYGTVLVRFSISRSGDVLAVSVFNSSGAPDLDDEAIATIWRARPMPAIPAVLPERLSVTLPVTFSATDTLARG